MGSLFVAADVGGTFTDLVVYDAERQELRVAKVLTTPEDRSNAIFEAFAKAGVQVPDIIYFKHGTTTAINTVIERTGAKTALITTKGFRDVLEAGRGNRPDSFNLFFHRLPPLVPRDLRFELNERLNGQGNEVNPVPVAELEALLPQLESLGVESIAVCFLHAYRNPAHELEVGAWLTGKTGAFISLSHELSREWREYERTATAVVNAYVGPRMSSYIKSLQDRLDGARFKGSFFLMESNGGVMAADLAFRKPVFLMESGPVAGVAAAAALSKQLGFPRAISFDMGGTTAKCALIERGQAAVTTTYWVGGYDRGYPIQAPVVDIIEVGAGGGSMAWINETGSLKVGPRSSGADPGPVCYRKGGIEPTVTDANLVLGRLDAYGFLGGEMVLDTEGARKAIETRIAQPLNSDVTTIANGILTLANVTMSTAVRRVSVERGFDPREFVLIVSGGAGPLHATAIARELSIPTVVVPLHPGHFSAWGMLLADIQHEFAQTHITSVAQLRTDEVEALYQSMEAQARDTLASEAPELRSIAFERVADARYVGQEHSVRIALPSDLLAKDAVNQILDTFNSAYAQRYGHSDPAAGVELVTLRVVATGAVDKPPLTTVVGAKAEARPVAVRPAYFEQTGYVDCPIYRRDLLGAGQRIQGPALVTDIGATTVIGPGDRAEIDQYGNIIIHVEARQRTAADEQLISSVREAGL